MKHVIWFAVFGLAACSSKEPGAPAKEPSNAIPEKPVTGAPMTFQVTSIKPGALFKSALQVRAYNFSDKTIGQYAVRLRSYDAKGERLVADPRSPDPYESYSFADTRSICAPKSWCEMQMRPRIPEGTASVVVLAEKLTAVKDDGRTIEDTPVFELDGSDWPAAAVAAKPAASK